MIDQLELQLEVRDMLIDVCEIFYRRGITEVPVEPLMLLLGIDAELAHRHSNDYILLDDTFETLASSYRNHLISPKGTLVH